MTAEEERAMAMAWAESLVLRQPAKELTKHELVMTCLACASILAGSTSFTASNLDAAARQILLQASKPTRPAPDIDKPRPASTNTEFC